MLHLECASEPLLGTVLLRCRRSVLPSRVQNAEDKAKNRLNLLALNLTPNLLKAQTRSRQIYRAAPTETSQGSAKFYKPQI
ncbi:hypothetical protein [Campylobacter showae]|uniref:hypothetical protein n=1 Tax=Campylobacter showae TaxID=204 RepID=UPI0028EE6E6F|nr:hypothetical protein [Campylobacter showae]